MASGRAFIGASTLLFGAGAAATIAWCAPMSAMDGMPMPGGWTMSMTWMPMPGQARLGAMASFVAMWVVMMVAMMMPSLAPVLWRYRLSAGGMGEIRPGRPTAIVGAGYFFVWIGVGLVVFPPGVALASLLMREQALARAVPIVGGVVVLLAGVVQLSAWKARRLACGREVRAHGRPLRADAGTAWRDGLRLGVHCVCCCVPLMAVLLVVGIMELRAMAVVTVAITAERLAPAGEWVARGIGAVFVGGGLLLIARAAGAA